MEHLSPELVLVASPAEARAAREALPAFPFVAPVRVTQPARPRRVALAAVYAGCLALTVTPVALLTLRDAPKRPPAAHRR